MVMIPFPFKSDRYDPCGASFWLSKVMLEKFFLHPLLLCAYDVLSLVDLDIDWVCWRREARRLRFKVSRVV